MSRFKRYFRVDPIGHGDWLDIMDERKRRVRENARFLPSEAPCKMMPGLQSSQRTHCWGLSTTSSRRYYSLWLVCQSLRKGTSGTLFLCMRQSSLKAFDQCWQNDEMRTWGMRVQGWLTYGVEQSPLSHFKLHFKEMILKLDSIVILPL